MYYYSCQNTKLVKHWTYLYSNNTLSVFIFGVFPICFAGKFMESDICLCNKAFLRLHHSPHSTRFNLCVYIWEVRRILVDNSDDRAGDNRP